MWLLCNRDCISSVIVGCSSCVILKMREVSRTYTKIDQSKSIFGSATSGLGLEVSLNFKSFHPMCLSVSSIAMEEDENLDVFSQELWIDLHS